MRCRESLDDIYGSNKDIFVLPHLSYIVNFSAIVSVSPSTVTLKNGEILNISASKKSEFHDRMNEFIQQRYRGM